MNITLSIILAFFILSSPALGVRYLINGDFVHKDPLCQALKRNFEKSAQLTEEEEPFELEINLGSLACAQVENISSFLIKLSKGITSGRKVSLVEIKDGSSRKFNLIFPALQTLVRANESLTLRYTHKREAKQAPRSAEKKLPTIKPGKVIERVPFAWESCEKEINEAFSASRVSPREEGLLKAQGLVAEAFNKETRDRFQQSLESSGLDGDGDLINLQKNEIVIYEDEATEERNHLPDKVKVIQVTGVVEDLGKLAKMIRILPHLKVIQFRQSAILASKLELLIEVMRACPGLLCVDIREGLYRTDPVGIFEEVLECIEREEAEKDLLKKFVVVSDLAELRELETYLKIHGDKVGEIVDEILHLQETYLSFKAYFDFILES